MNLAQSIGLLFVLTGLAVINALLSHYGLEAIQGQFQFLAATFILTLGGVFFLAGAK